MKKVVKIACRGADFASLDDFLGFQGNLKHLSDANYLKLKNLIIELGFSEPIGVWFDGDKKQIISGHQRVFTLKKMRDEGFKVPHLPYSVVEAKDAAEAKRKVLALASEFGHVTEEGLAEFVAENELEISEVEETFAFDSIDYDALEPEEEDPPNKGKEVEVSGHTRTVGADDEDEEEDPPEKIKIGEIFLLNESTKVQEGIDTDGLIELLQSGELEIRLLVDEKPKVQLRKKTN